MTGTKRILVVENDLATAEAMYRWLTDAGFAVTVVDHGLAALCASAETEPDLVILSLNLPKTSGLRLVDIFARCVPAVPVLVITTVAFAEVGDVGHAGVADTIAKPVEGRTLLRKVANALDRAAARRTVHPPRQDSTTRRPSGG